MAKGSAMGLWKGKKGSSVFYQIKNSNSLQKQGVRERNYEPANPQTASQAGQRMRMYPAQAVYGALKSTIERSWQGVKYGQMTRQAYLKAALRVDLFPAVDKGMSVVVPGPYQIAKGSLQEVPVIFGPSGVTFSFVLTNSYSYDDSYGDLCQELLDQNPWLQEGDQISIVWCRTDVNGDGFYWGTSSFIIDSQSTSDIGSVMEAIGFKSPGNQIGFQQSGIVLAGDDFIYMAVACVISRDGTTPLRSNATLVCNYDAGQMPNYYSTEAVNRARKSYQKQEYVRATDWPVDPGEQGGGSGGDDYTITVNQVTIQAGGTEDPTPGGTVSGGGSYLIGERVTLTATPDGAHDFVGWFPSKEDALANTNRISTSGIYLFVAGDLHENVTTFFGKFAPQL